jgi:hypothetical protein
MPVFVDQGVRTQPTRLAVDLKQPPHGPGRVLSLMGSVLAIGGLSIALVWVIVAGFVQWPWCPVANTALSLPPLLFVKRRARAREYHNRSLPRKLASRAERLRDPLMREPQHARHRALSGKRKISNHTTLLAPADPRTIQPTSANRGTLWAPVALRANNEEETAFRE